MKHKINIKGSICENNKQTILKCIKATLESEQFPYLTLIDVSVITDYEMKRLNQKHRNIDKTTDVLSFPMIDFIDGTCVYDLACEINPEDSLLFLGDIIISKERITAQAEEYGHSFTRELGFLTIHSVLHLLGYDHIDTSERKILMREKEQTILDKVGLTLNEN